MHLAYKTFLAKEFYNFSSNSEKKKFNIHERKCIFSECALKEHLKMIKMIESDPELNALVESLDTTDMFEALKKTAFAMFASDPTDKDLFDRAYKAVAEDREYTEGKKTRQEIDTRVTQVSEMTIEQLETQLRDLDIEEVEPEE